MTLDMRRPPVTVVVRATHGGTVTRSCLELLRPTLSVRDRVLIAHQAPVDLDRWVRALPWATVLDTSDVAAMVGLGEAVETDVVVVMDDDVLVTGHWLDTLVEALGGDPDAVAAGPSSNRGRPPQLVASAGLRAIGDLRAFGRQWYHEHVGEVVATSDLDGACVALRRRAVDDVGGWPALLTDGLTAALWERLTGAGQRLLVGRAAFVHGGGPRGIGGDRPLVSACLIVKDEVDNLPACLGSLRGVADEVVVYDTGSSDDTVAVATGLGATVIEGYWDDDFARARNAALEHCRGDWIAWLDADETLVCDDPAALRDLLQRTRVDVDAWSVAIDNLTGAGVGAGFVHRASRLFRRERCHWIGRLHEQVARRGEQREITQAELEIARIRHTGYLDTVMASRNKVERNLRVAEREVAEADGFDKGFSLTSLGRSHMTAGRYDQAIACCDQALAHTDSPITRRLAMRTAAEAAIALGELAEARTWIDRLRAASTTPIAAQCCEVKLALASGEHQRAVELLEPFRVPVADEDGFEYTPTMLAAQWAEALLAVGRAGEAADLLLTGLADDGALETHLGIVVDLLRRAERPLTELARVIPEAKAVPFLAQVRQLVPHLADQVLEACWTVSVLPIPVLATAATVAPRLEVARALVWSARLRSAGQSDSCPLLAIAADPARDPVDQARAAATAYAAFRDERAHARFRAVLETAPEGDGTTIRTEAAMLCPALVATGPPPTGGGPVRPTAARVRPEAVPVRPDGQRCADAVVSASGPRP
jgi:GT2 family glycosyltransferase